LAVHTYREKYATVGDIVEGINLPKAITAKTLQILARNKIINSVKGKKAASIFRKILLKRVHFLFSIVQILDGEGIINKCNLGIFACSSAMPCPVHPKYEPTKEQLTGFLINTILSDLTTGISENEFFLSLCYIISLINY
jgi:Rrf2 family transcriptional regulator, iron-sulfur cluster assembly transcription factor